MGIPVYFKTLIEDYNDLCLPHTRKLTIDNLYFDLNCLIHPCCRGLTDETEMIHKILSEIQRIIEEGKKQGCYKIVGMFKMSCGIY